VQTFLTILSKKPDSLIQRKVGLQIALDISQSASQILSKDGLTSLTVKQDLENLDSVLRTNSHKLNPGTTADLTCSSIYLAILEGFRP
jgi:triphosphoribosyl-dephospho-CoA synthase